MNRMQSLSLPIAPPPPPPPPAPGFTDRSEGCRRRRRHLGFTLVELMISIALVLLLVIGINAVFRTTADTISGGQAALSNSRELRNAFQIFNSDFTGFMGAESQPLLIIYSQNLPGFRDKADEQSDPDSLANPNDNDAVLWLRNAQGAI